MLIIIIAALLILSFFPFWQPHDCPEWDKEQEDREQEEYLKKWLEERRQ